MNRSRVDRGLLAAGFAAPAGLALLAFVLWPAPAVPRGDACVRTASETDWLGVVGVVTGGLVLGLGLLVWLRRMSAGWATGIWRLPWETALIAGLVAGMWSDRWYPALIVFQPMIGGVVAIVLLGIATVSLLRRGSDRFLVPAIWVDALCLLPALFLLAALSDNTLQICF